MGYIAWLTTILIAVQKFTICQMTDFHPPPLIWDFSGLMSNGAQLSTDDDADWKLLRKSGMYF